MADDPNKKKPRKGKFPAPELAKNKPAGIPKSYYGSPEAQILQDRLNTQQALGGDEPVFAKAKPERPLNIWTNTPRPNVGLDRQIFEQPYLNPNPFAAPDLGAGMNPFSGGGAGTLNPADVPGNVTERGLKDLNAGKPPLKKIPGIASWRPEVPGDFAQGLTFDSNVDDPRALADAVRQRQAADLKAWSQSEYMRSVIRDPKMAERIPGMLEKSLNEGPYPWAREDPRWTPDLAHPEARDGLYPSKPFLGQYQVGWNENPQTGYQQIIDDLPVARQARPTQHLTDYPMPTYRPRPPLTFNPAVVEVADMAGVPTTLPSLGAGFALGAGHTLGEMYAPIDTRAFDQALMQTQDTVERFMYPQPVYQGVQAGRELLGRGMTAVGNAANAGGNWLLEQAMGTPAAWKPPASRQIVPTDMNMRLDPFVGRMFDAPDFKQAGAGRAKPRKKTKK